MVGRLGNILALLGGPRACIGSQFSLVEYVSLTCNKNNSHYVMTSPVSSSTHDQTQQIHSRTAKKARTIINGGSGLLRSSSIRGDFLPRSRIGSHSSSVVGLSHQSILKGDRGGGGGEDSKPPLSVLAAVMALERERKFLGRNLWDLILISWTRDMERWVWVL